MDHQPPSSDTKKPTSAPHQADEVLPDAEELRDVASTVDIGKVQSAAAGSLNRKQINALQRMIGNQQTGRLLNRISRTNSGTMRHHDHFHIARATSRPSSVVTNIVPMTATP